MSIAIIFSGQGLQTLKHYQELMDWLELEGLKSSFKDVLPELFQDNPKKIEECLADNKIAQPFLVALHYCRWQKLNTLGVDATIFLGYSLGEFSAFCCSIGLDFISSVRLARYRAYLMSNAYPMASSLLSVQGLSLKQLNLFLERTQTHISIILSPVSVIIGGETRQLIQLQDMLKGQGSCQTKQLNVSVASHTPLMQPASIPFEDCLSPYKHWSLTIPLLSGTDGQMVYQATQAINNLSYQLDHCIDWYTTLQMLKEYQPNLVLEIGAGNAISKMIMEHLPLVPTRSIDDFSDLQHVTSWIKQRQ